MAEVTLLNSFIVGFLLVIIVLIKPLLDSIDTNAVSILLGPIDLEIFCPISCQFLLMLDFILKNLYFL